MPFNQMLTALVRAVPGGQGAILIDREGEAVDQHTLEDPYQMKVAGAHWGIIRIRLEALFDHFAAGLPRESIITTTNQHVLMGCVGEEYFLVLTLDRLAAPLKGLLPFRETVERLRKEIY